MQLRAFLNSTTVKMMDETTFCNFTVTQWYFCLSVGRVFWNPKKSPNGEQCPSLPFFLLAWLESSIRLVAWAWCWTGSTPFEKPCQKPSRWPADIVKADHWLDRECQDKKNLKQTTQDKTGSWSREKKSRNIYGLACRVREMPTSEAKPCK